MSTPVGNHGLSCLDGADYGAVALSLQANAGEIDDTLTQIQANLNLYNNRGWALSTSTSSFTLASTAFDFVDQQFLPGSYLFNNANFSDQSFGMDTLPFFSTPILAAGWYMAGCYVTFQATGAVTANSRRNIGLDFTHIVNGVTIHDYAINMVYESNTGGDAMTVAGFFQANGVSQYNLDANFWHNNTGSTIQVNAGAKIWIAYMGTGVVI